MSKKDYFNKHQSQAKPQGGVVNTEETQDVVVSTAVSSEEIVETTPTVEETKPEVVTTAAPAAVETKIPEVVKKPQAKQPKEGFTPVYKVELELNGYADAMDRSKSIVPEEGGKWQYSLFNNIKSVFSAKSQEEFNAEFNTILHFFNKNKDGIFNEQFIFRFPEYWPGSPNEFTLYRRIVYLIVQTADVKARKKALEQISLEMVAEGLSEPHKQFLFNFYVM